MQGRKMEGTPPFTLWELSKPMVFLSSGMPKPRVPLTPTEDEEPQAYDEESKR